MSCSATSGGASPAPSGTDAGTDDAPAAPDAGGAPIALPNGVAVSSSCGQPHDANVVFSSAASHPFVGYGTNVEMPQQAALARFLADMDALHFQWVKTDLGNPYKKQNGPTPPSNVDDATMYATIAPTIKTAWSNTAVPLVKGLHDHGIKLVSTMYGAPAAYAMDDSHGGHAIDPAHIMDFAQFYVASFHVMNDLGIVPDVTELQNEPNGDWDVKWTPAQYAEFVADIRTVLARNPGVVGNVGAAGTSTQVSNAVDFITAIGANTPSLSAITMHNYYVVDAPNNGGIPPAEDPALQQLVGLAKGVPILSTELGGTDSKTKSTDPNLESINPAEELKAALDLVREGDSGALIWALYPNSNGGQLLKTWALIDENGPTNGYWPFLALVPNIPAGASVLAVQSSDVATGSMTSLGYAAFATQDQVVVALSNPGDKDLAVAVDVAGASLTLTHVRSFDATQVFDVAASLPRGDCPLTIAVPGDTAKNDTGKGVVLTFARQ